MDYTRSGIQVLDETADECTVIIGRDKQHHKECNTEIKFPDFPKQIFFF